MDDYPTMTKRVRREVIDLIYRAQTSHIGSNLSCIDFATVLYDNINLKSADDSERDIVIWSKGWAAATAYVLLKDKGILTPDVLLTYGRDDGLLGLVECSTPGIEASTGSMGHGLPMGVGFAFGRKRSVPNSNVFVIMSDGELDCGTTWESALLAAHHTLGNLTVLVDVNGWQAMGRTRDVLFTDSIKAKFLAFGWNVMEVDGHDPQEILRALFRKKSMAVPKVILFNTVKGKGVSVMEDKLEWHYRNIDDETYQIAMKELA